MNASSAIESVQAEEINRLQQQREQAQAFTPSSEWQLVPEGTAVPPGGDFRMDMESGQNFGRWPDLSPTPLAPPPPLGRTSFDAEAANARAASRPMASFPARALDTTISAPANAGASFDAAAYDQAIRAQLQQAGITPPAKADPQGVLSQDELTSLLAQRQASVAPAVPAPRPLSPYPTYEDAAQTKADILNDARNLYTARGDFGSIGSPMFQAELGEAYQSAGLAPPMEKPSPFQEAHAQASDLTADLRDTYAAQGRYGEIGQSGFQKDLAAILRQVGLGVPEEKPRPFQEAQAQVSALTDDLKDSYTAQGRYAEIGQAGFREELAGSLHQAGLGPEPKDPGLSGAYKDQSQRRSQVEGALRDAYTLRGDYDKVGGTEYKSALQSSLEEAGLASPAEAPKRGFAGAVANIREDFKSPFGPLQYGYAASAIIQGGVRDYAANNSGQYLTPEQKETANAGLLPGIGTLTGTILGAAVPGLGSWAGSLAGQAVGSGIQGVIGANEERNQTTREAAERLAASLGLAADSVGSFKTQIEATGASAQQVAQGLSALQATGPGVGADAIAGVGRTALSEGEYYGADTASHTQFLSSSPALAPLMQQYRRNGQMTSGQYGSIAQLALAEGNTEEFNAAQLSASRAPLNNNAAYQGAARHIEDVKREGLGTGSWAVGFASWYRQYDPTFHNDITDAQDVENTQAAQAKAQADATGQKYVNEYLDINRGRQGLIDAGLNVKIGQTGLATAEAGGAGSAEMRRLAPGINASLDAATAADQTIISTDTGLMNGLTAATDPTSSLRTSYQTLINQARADQVQNPLAKAQLARSIYDTSLQEDESAFGLSLTTQQSGLTRSLLSGRRYDQLAGDENGVVSAENARAAQIRRSAENPLVAPAERSRMLTQADSIETGAAVQQHDFQQNVYRQAAAQDDLTVGRAGLGVEQARAFGTEASVYGAQGQEADALRAKMAELTRQLAAGGNSADEVAEKMRQITQAGGQLNSVLAQQRDERLAAQQSVASSQFQQDTAGLGRQVQIGGSGAVNIDTINADFQKRFAADQAAINEYKPGDPRHDAAQAKLAQDRAESRDYEGGLTRYTPSAQTSIQGLAVEDETERARHAFQREMLTPYRTGDPNSDPLTRGLGLEKALDKSAAFVDTQAQAATAYRSAQQNKVGADGKPLWDSLAEENYQRQMIGFHDRKDNLLDQRASLEHDRLWEEDRRLPEMIAGGGGLSGNSVLAVPQAALSALFHPNVRDGGWGHPVTQPGLSRPGSMPGNTYDGFQDHNFQQHGMAGSGTSAAPTSAIVTAIRDAAHQSGGTQQVTLLQRIYDILARIEAGNRAPLPPPGSPLMTGGSNTVQNNRQSANTNRLSLR